MAGFRVIDRNLAAAIVKQFSQSGILSDGCSAVSADLASEGCNGIVVGRNAVGRIQIAAINMRSSLPPSAT
jgi:hypothetical protein